MVWKKGESGNPTGKPAGARNKATIMVQAIMERGAQEITDAVVTAAKGGDLGAARLVLERLVPPAKERPIFLNCRIRALLMASHKLRRPSCKPWRPATSCPEKAATLAGIVEARRKAVETQELEARISALEVAK
jgi:hypothetical protein